MSTKFTNTSSGIWKDFGTPGTKWKFDTTGYTLRTIDCTLEYLECKIYVGSYGNMVTELKELTTEMYAGSSFNTEFEKLTCDMDGTTRLYAMDCSFEQLIFQGYGMNTLTCTIEYFEFQAWSLFGADIECEMKAFTLTSTGSNAITGVNSVFEELECEMHTGFSIGTTLKSFTFTGQAHILVQGDVEASLKSLTCEFTSGVKVNTQLEYLTYTSEASNPVIGEIEAQIQCLTSSFLATTHAILGIVANIRDLHLNMEGTQLNLEDLINLQSATERLNITLSGINGLVADLEASFWELDVDFVGLTENIGDLVSTLEEIEFEGEAYSGELSDCTNVILAYGI